jgi:hypothetical protein
LLIRPISAAAFPDSGLPVSAYSLARRCIRLITRRDLGIHLVVHRHRSA